MFIILKVTLMSWRMPLVSRLDAAEMKEKMDISKIKILD